MPRQSRPHLHNGYYRCRIDGTEHHLGKDKRAAEREFHRLMAERLADTESDKPMTINGAVVAWLKLNEKPCYANWLAPFSEWAGEVRLADIGRDFLTRFRVYLAGQKVKRRVYDRTHKMWVVKATDKPLANKTIGTYVKTAAAVLRWADRQDWLGEMPDAPKMPKPVRKARDVEPDRLAQILDELPERAGRILRFIAYTGCRPDEACRLEWRHVHHDARVCVLDEHKTGEATGKPRTLYLTDEALAVLRELSPTIGPVFTNRKGQPYKPSGLRSILKRHGGIVPYALRHTFAQTASEEIPVEVLARMMGHADTKTTAFYFEVRDKRALAAARTVKIHKLNAAAG